MKATAGSPGPAPWAGAGLGSKANLPASVPFELHFRQRNFFLRSSTSSIKVAEVEEAMAR